MEDIAPELKRFKQLWDQVQQDKQKLDGYSNQQQVDQQTKVLQHQIDQLTNVAMINQQKIQDINREYQQNKYLQLEYQQRLDQQDEQEQYDEKVRDDVQENYRREIEEKDEEIQMLKQQMEQQQNKLSKQSMKQIANNQQNEIQKVQMDKKDDTIRQLQVEIEKQKLQMEQVELEAMKSRFKDIYIEQLKTDKDKLIDMIKMTNEFKQIYKSEGQQYLKKVNVKAFDQSKQIVGCDKQYWVPEQAQQFITKFRLDYKGKLNDELVDLLLFELNCLWRNKEQKSLKAMKEKYQCEVNHLKRQLACKQQLTQQQLMKEVIRLETQLKQAYKENREYYRQQQQLDNGYIQEVLKMAKNMDRSSQEKKRMQERRMKDIDKVVGKCEGDTKKAFKRGVGYVLDGIQKVLEQSECVHAQNMLRDKMSQYQDIV